MENKIHDVTKEADKGPTFGERHVQALLLFVGITTEMMTRNSLSLSIVAMTDKTASVNENIPTYSWKDRDIILSSFYWSYPLLQVVMGQAAKNYGPKWILFITLTLNSGATALIPTAADYWGSKGVMACRILQGLCQGGVYPCVSTMLGRWAPQNETGRMATFVYSSISFASIVCLPVTGLICRSYIGWPVSFYLFSGCGCLWSIVWLFMGHNSPAAHPTITEAERRYIEESLDQSEETEVIPTPWRAMFSSSHFWAMTFSVVSSGYATTFFQNEIPTYLKNAMKYDIASSGYLTSMAFAVGVFTTYIYGPLSDFLIERHYLTRTNTRKFFQAFACFGSTASLLTLAYLSQSRANWAPFMISVSSAFFPAILFGQGVNQIELSPRFSGIILAFSNSMSCIAALCAPLSVQYIVTDQANLTQWRIVFTIAAAFLIASALSFILFASGERQWWDDGPVKISKDAPVKKTSAQSSVILRKFSACHTLQI